MTEMSDEVARQRYIKTLTSGIALWQLRAADVSTVAKGLVRLGFDHWLIWDRTSRNPTGKPEDNIAELVEGLKECGVNLPSTEEAFNYLACGHVLEMLRPDIDPLEPVQEIYYLFGEIESTESLEFEDTFYYENHYVNEFLTYVDGRRYWYYGPSPEEMRESVRNNALTYLKKYHPDLLSSAGETCDYFDKELVSLWANKPRRVELPAPVAIEPIPNFEAIISNSYFDASFVYCTDPHETKQPSFVYCTDQRATSQAGSEEALSEPSIAVKSQRRRPLINLLARLAKMVNRNFGK